MNNLKHNIAVNYYAILLSLRFMEGIIVSARIRIFMKIMMLQYNNTTAIITPIYLYYEPDRGNM